MLVKHAAVPGVEGVMVTKGHDDGGVWVSSFKREGPKGRRKRFRRKAVCVLPEVIQMPHHDTEVVSGFGACIETLLARNIS